MSSRLSHKIPACLSVAVAIAMMASLQAIAEQGTVSSQSDIGSVHVEDGNVSVETPATSVTVEGGNVEVRGAAVSGNGQVDAGDASVKQPGKKKVERRVNVQTGKHGKDAGASANASVQVVAPASGAADETDQSDAINRQVDEEIKQQQRELQDEQRRERSVELPVDPD